MVLAAIVSSKTNVRIDFIFTSVTKYVGRILCIMFCLVVLVKT